MLTAGLVSVTFRKLSIDRITALINEAGLTSVEWGADVHVPCQQSDAITQAVQSCRNKNVQIASYGSYYRADATTEELDRSFLAHLDCTLALGTSNIRIWAGMKGSAECTPDERRAYTDNIRHVCMLAQNKNVNVSLEFHGGTLTDECNSALQLVEDVGMQNLRLYWQPNQFRDAAYNLSTLRQVLPFVSNVHVFSWQGNERFPLAAQESLWRQYIEICASSGRDHHMLMEFVCDETEKQFFTDAAVLLDWLS